MLNKQICKKCINKHSWGWNNSDESIWSVGELVCPYTLENSFLFNINDNPHKNCLYKLEHIISMESKINA